MKSWKLTRTKRWLLMAGCLLAAGLMPLLSGQVGAAGDLLTYWNMDEPAVGDTVVDSSGSGFNGVPHGVNSNVNDDSYRPQPSTDVPVTTFPDTHSLHFLGDGSNSTGSYIDVSNWNVDTSNGFTVSLWAKPTGGGAWERFFDFGNGPGSDNIVFAQYDTTNQVYFEVYNGASTTKIIGPPGSWTYDSWHYYAATIDADGNATIYIDGNPVVSGTTNKPLNLARTNKYIGKSNWGDSYYEGYMDDMRVYGRALTQSEVEGLTNGEPGPGVSVTGQAVNDNGITDAEEDAAPNNGDANGDGTPDKQQANVASFLNTQTGSYTSVTTDSSCTLSSLTDNALTDNGVKDGGYRYPHGFVGFDSHCGTAGYGATVTLYFYGIDAGQYVARKYNPVTHAYGPVPGATISQATIGGRPVIVVTYRITDGGPLDADGAANGTIVDPVGLAVAPAAAISPQAPDTGLMPRSSTGSEVLVLVAGVSSVAAGLGVWRNVALRRREDRT